MKQSTIMAFTVLPLIFATCEANERDNRQEASKILRKNESSGVTVSRIQLSARIGKISKSMKIKESQAFQALNIGSSDIYILNQATVDAAEKGLFGRRQEFLFDKLEENPNNEAYRSIFANIQILAVKNMLTDKNLKWQEAYEDRTVIIDSMSFMSNQALEIANSNSSKFVQFMTRKTILEARGSSSREAIKQSLSEVGVSYKEFVEKCFVKPEKKNCLLF